VSLPEAGKIFAKLNIGLKESNESVFWLQHLYATDFITKKMFDSMMTDAAELLIMLIASVKTP
jgi:four helix bundle protein